MTTGDRIRVLRKEHLRCTQDEFANNINMSRSNLGSIETNRVSVTDRVCNDICNTYNVEPLWLKTGEGEVFRPGRSNVARRILTVMADLPEEYWNVLGDIIDRYNKTK